MAGTTDTYTVVVSNTGPSDASNLSVVDTLPTQGFTNITSPNLPAGVTFNAATDTWTLASLPAGQSVTLQLAGTVPSGATGSTYVNTATASASDASTVTATDTDTLGTHANLAITKTDNDGGSSVTSTVGSAIPGTSITYTIVASNSGPSTATGVTVTTRWLEHRHQLRQLDGHRIGWGHRLQRFGNGEHQRLVDHPGRRLGHLHGDRRHPLLGHRHPDQHGHSRRL